VTNYAAYQLRENTGTTGLEQAARSAAELLAHFDIPHLIVGGLAVQEHGYPRLTTDVDIVVQDVLEAVEFLTSGLSGPFQRIPNVDDRLIDKRNGVKIDLLPAGKVLRPGCQVPFPEPKEVSDRPKFITIEELISLKLDSWKVSPLRRTRDKSDVIELISRRKLPRELAVAPAVKDVYVGIWDGLQAEGDQEKIHPV
jgi:hypothetical protein